jgi:surface antigen
MILSTGLLAGALLSAGCESMSNTAKGGLIGGGAGAGLGALAGGGKGALIGGLAGTVLGGVVGNDVDNEEKKQNETRLAVAETRAAVAEARAPGAQTPLGLTDVIQLTRDGVHEDVIVNQIRGSGSTFQLSNEDVRFLTSNNVSPRVIVEMQHRRPVARVVREQPQVIYRSPPPPPVVVYESYPAPVMGVGYYQRWR